MGSATKVGCLLLTGHKCWIYLGVVAIVTVWPSLRILLSKELTNRNTEIV